MRVASPRRRQRLASDTVGVDESLFVSADLLSDAVSDRLAPLDVDSDLDSLFDSPLDSPLDVDSAWESALASAPDSFFDSAFAAGLLPFLKSVAYQPEPLSLNPAAETSLVSVSLWHAGQVMSRGSVIFCSASCSFPHDAQRYS